MSRRTRFPRAAVSTGIALTALGVAGAPAHANTSATVRLSCDFPLVGASFIDATVTTQLPPTTFIGLTLPASNITVTAVSVPGGAGTDEAFTALELVKSANVKGDAWLDTSLVVPSGEGGTSSIGIRSALSLANAPVPATPPWSFTASGSLPPITVPRPGAGGLDLDGLDLNLVAEDQYGNPITTFAQVQNTPDSDGNLNTFDAPCTPAPGENRRVAQIEWTPIGTPLPSPTPGLATPTPTPSPSPSPRPTSTEGTPTPQPGGPTPTPTPLPGWTPPPPTPTAVPTPTPPPGPSNVTCDLPLVGEARMNAEFQRYLGRDEHPGALGIFGPVTSAQSADGIDHLNEMGKLVGLWSLEGAMSADVVTHQLPENGQAFDRDGTVPMTILPAYTQNDAPVVFHPYGQSSSDLVTAQMTGSEVTSFSLNLRATDNFGHAITQLSEVQNHPDSDGDPETFDVPCVADSPIAVHPPADPTPTPTPPPTPAPSTTPTSTPPITPTSTPPITPTPSPGQANFKVAGSATLKTLTKGSLPVKGSAAATVDGSGGFSAALTLDPSQGQLLALGFLPVTAKVQIVPLTPATGQLTGSGLTASTTVRIKVPSVTLLGLQLAGGANCQAKNPSAIALKSQGAFSVGFGGTLAGTFSISNLTGCGFLNGLVSPLTTGSGNALALRLTPTP